MFINSLKSNFSLEKISWLFYLLSAFILLLAFIGDNGYIEYSLIQKDIMSLEKQIDKLISKKQVFMSTLHSMKKDNLIYENIARKKLGLVKKDEIIIVLKYVD